MAGIVRTTVSGVGGKYPSRVPGTRAGLSLNTFGLDALRNIIGEDLVPILLKNMRLAYNQAKADWPVITGASTDSMDVTVTEVGHKMARVALQIGGPRLIEDPRNKSHKDYAPFVEYNGTSKTPAGTLTHAMIVNQQAMAEGIREDVTALIAERLRQGIREIRYF